MIDWFKQLLLVEKFILVAYALGAGSWIILFTRDTKAWWEETKQLFFPKYIFKLYRFLAKKRDEAGLVGAFIKGSFIFAYVPAVCWLAWWLISKLLPVGEYLYLVTPMSVSHLINLLGYQATSFDFYGIDLLPILSYLPLPFFYAKSEIMFYGLSLAWALTCNVRLNKIAQAYFRDGDFKKDFLAVLKAHNAFVEARDNKMPYVRDVKNGLALVSTRGISLTPQRVKELAPIIESNLGCWITKVDQGQNKDEMIIGYRYQPFPEMIKFNPEKHRHPNPRFIVMGTDMNELVGHAFTKDANVLIAGLPGKGKTYSLVTMSMSIFAQNPNSILIVIDAAKQAIDFGFLKFDPEEHKEFLRGERDAHDVHQIPLVLVIDDPNKVENVLRWCLGEMERRNRLCGDMRYLANGLRDLYANPNYKDDPLPAIYIMTDETALLNDMIDDNSDSAFNRVARLGRAFDMNCIFATQQTYQKDVSSRRNFLTPYSFYMKASQLKLVGIDLQVPNEAGVFAYETANGGMALAKGFFVDKKECAPFIAQQTKKANRTTHKLFQELKAASQENFDADLMDKVERKLTGSKLSHMEPVITDYREAA